jgi:hypothetical protein
VVVLAQGLHEGIDPLGHRGPQNAVPRFWPACVSNVL